ncbi:Tfp pilus assembly protein FimT/FimU [Planctomycetota bacterium]
MRKVRAYTLVELLVVVMTIAVLATIAVPRLQFGAVDRQITQTTTRKLVMGLRRARALAMSEAVSSPAGFALVLSGAPAQRYEIRNSGSGSIIDSYVLNDTVDVRGSDGQTFHFGPLGNLQDGSATRMTVRGPRDRTTLTVIAATGAVTTSDE